MKRTLIIPLLFSCSAIASHPACDDAEVLSLVNDIGKAMVAEETDAFEDEVDFAILRVQESSVTDGSVRNCQARVKATLPNKEEIVTRTSFQTQLQSRFSGEFLVWLEGDIRVAIMEHEFDNEMAEYMQDVEDLMGSLEL